MGIKCILHSHIKSLQCKTVLHFNGPSLAYFHLSFIFGLNVSSVFPPLDKKILLNSQVFFFNIIVFFKENIASSLTWFSPFAITKVHPKQLKSLQIHAARCAFTVTTTRGRCCINFALNVVAWHSPSLQCVYFLVCEMSVWIQIKKKIFNQKLPLSPQKKSAKRKFPGRRGRAQTGFNCFQLRKWFHSSIGDYNWTCLPVGGSLCTDFSCFSGHWLLIKRQSGWVSAELGQVEHAATGSAYVMLSTSFFFFHY